MLALERLTTENTNANLDAALILNSFDMSCQKLAILRSTSELLKGLNLQQCDIKVQALKTAFVEDRTK